MACSVRVIGASQCSFAATAADWACMLRETSLAPATAIDHQFSNPTIFASSRGVTVAAWSIATHRL